MAMKKNLSEAAPALTVGQRGPAEHERRAQIVEAADAHIRHYGYHKTTVADLAKAVGLSTAYIYKFFESKQAIGEAICARCLGMISDELRQISYEKKPASDRLRCMYKSAGKQAVRLFFNDRKLHDIVRIAIEEHWQTTRRHKATVLELILHVVSEGRASGEFEASTPLIKTCNAIAQTFELVSHPVLLEEHFDEVDERTDEISGLALRSLLAK